MNVTLAGAVALMGGAAALVAAFVPKANAWLAARYAGGTPTPVPQPDAVAVFQAVQGYKVGADGKSVVAR